MTAASTPGHDRWPHFDTSTRDEILAAAERATPSRESYVSSPASAASPSAATTLVPCFVCGREMEQVHTSPTQPHDGLTFIASGNYGSRIFDPLLSLERLHIIVCDSCATERADRIAAVLEQRTRPTFKYRTGINFEDFKEEVIPDE